MQRRNLLKATIAVAASAAFMTSLTAPADDRVIKVGIISRPDAQIWQVVPEGREARRSQRVKVIEFNDYVQLNAALDAGDLDANSFQHQPYLDAAQLPRTLTDVDAAAINTNFALAAGLQPTKDAIALEDVHSPYANLIAVRAKDKDQP